MSHRHHWRGPLFLGIMGAAALSTARHGMLGRFFWRLGVFLAACWSFMLLALALAALLQIGGGPSPASAYGNIALALLIGDAVILFLAAGLAWVCGGAPWARS